ncbi:hypothetical protein [Paraburkholderia phenazinium]|uniref:Uncharacterized protein n=1 Tax=Paraburkholderia phenazinium TaxID=60549 RepID=A0A1N6KP71_9BURK|nr:hypothetical protein [Paraburkholderia phenazinium]SIO58310.1 hypothetical protein SAMN05444165_4097 [Paraburkholderia phenazinium]
MRRSHADNDLLEAVHEGLGTLAKICACAGAAATIGAALYVALAIGVGCA